MRASPDELKSLFKQAFEACGYDFGGYEVAAEMVVWSQMHGFNIFPVIQECLLPLAQNSLSPKVLLDEPHKLIFDNQGHSVLVSASQIVNLACAKAMQRGFCVLQVQNCEHPVMLAKLLCDSNNFGLHANAYWYQAQTQQTLELRTDALQACPELRYYSNVGGDLSASGLNPGQLNIIFSRQDHVDDAELFADTNKLFENAQLDQRLTPQYFVQHYQQSLDLGIEIEADLWQQLLEIGAEVLVESTEQSRQGAGS
ncbi:MAG: LDH2 family malate/lactate/ureidoglycolate dehydrogenase [Arenicella sp.]|jgi:LDH2 family malate/lactate/ureidoglycolate dehydrogenase